MGNHRCNRRPVGQGQLPHPCRSRLQDQPRRPAHARTGKSPKPPVSNPARRWPQALPPRHPSCRITPEHLSKNHTWFPNARTLVQPASSVETAAPTENQQYGHHRMAPNACRRRQYRPTALRPALPTHVPRRPQPGRPPQYSDKPAFPSKPTSTTSQTKASKHKYSTTASNTRIFVVDKNAQPPGLSSPPPQARLSELPADHPLHQSLPRPEATQNSSTIGNNPHEPRKYAPRPRHVGP